VARRSTGDEDRGAAMAVSVARTARELGVPAEAIPRLSVAHALAMAPRVSRLESQRHPVYLHPGHTMLVLLRDAEVLDPVMLAAAALTESEDAELRIAGEVVRREMGDDVADLVAAVPMPGREELLEELVIAPEEVRLVALAERLDHLRHAHMRRDLDEAWRRAVHEEAMRVYLPVAERTHGKLAGRYRHWGKAFARRLMLGLDGRSVDEP
jgi:(p)ppGpp synthase/HD superfamily hydrolase